MKGRSKKPVAVPVVIEPTRTGFSAFSPVVDGCVSVGRTLDETLGNMREALEAHLELVRLLQKKPIHINRVLRFAYAEHGDEAVYAVVKLSA